METFAGQFKGFNVMYKVLNTESISGGGWMDLQGSVYSDLSYMNCG